MVQHRSEIRVKGRLREREESPGGAGRPRQIRLPYKRTEPAGLSIPLPGMCAQVDLGKLWTLARCTIELPRLFFLQGVVNFTHDAFHVHRILDMLEVSS
jgi:hypothetical protein